MLVHPHVRGEHSVVLMAQIIAAGSSPRAWGTRVFPSLVNKLQRFIPTCVGNTCAAAGFSWSVTVHPHVRGEHSSDGRIGCACIGSSPRAWGTPICAVITCSILRFIPTCVGNTPYFRPSPLDTPVHPHVRGEHVFKHSRKESSIGSSPRAWGTLSLARSNIPHLRFIPTCVGNTSRYNVVISFHAVHPHVRGEHSCQAS